MKLIIILQTLGFLIVLFSTIFASASLAEESNSNNNSVQQITEPNSSNASDSELCDAVFQAIEELSVLPEDIPVTFPLGANSPIRVGQIPDDNTPSQANGLIAEGFINANGQFRQFTPDILINWINMLTGCDNGRNLAMTLEAQEILVPDASGTFFQAKRIPVIDLIVRNSKDGRRYLLRNVNVNGVDRDVLNAVFYRTLRWNYQD